MLVCKNELVVIRSPQQQQWFQAQSLTLLALARQSLIKAGGFGALNDRNQLDPDAPADTILTARHTHSFGLATLLGIPGYEACARHGLQALRTLLRDETFGGWVLATPANGDFSKHAYCHAFVALAASTACICRFPGAESLLSNAIDVFDAHFWSETEGAMKESLSRDWKQDAPYRGANANMHSVEAFLAIADTLNDPVWTDRALRICTRIIRDYATHHDFQVAEHFDCHWVMQPEFNADKPADVLHPYGTTPGHAAEWSHLLLKLEASLVKFGKITPDWLLPASRNLFASAMQHGWVEGDHPGLVYTLDWQKSTKVGRRLHWALAEGVNAAASLWLRTGEDLYCTWHRRLWDTIATYFIDPEDGSWWNELDEANSPQNACITPGKSDLYHAFQATLAPTLPLSSSFARAIQDSRQ